MEWLNWIVSDASYPPIVALPEVGVKTKRSDVPDAANVEAPRTMNVLPLPVTCALEFDCSLILLAVTATCAFVPPMLTMLPGPEEASRPSSLPRLNWFELPCTVTRAASRSVIVADVVDHLQCVGGIPPLADLVLIIKVNIVDRVPRITRL